MFHRSSFSPKSFSTKSWRFDREPVSPEPPADVLPIGSGRWVTPERKKRKRNRDDEVLLFLLR